MTMLNDSQIERYSRQLVLPGWGMEQQLRLISMSIAVERSLLGAAYYLAAAGAGGLVIFDGGFGAELSGAAIEHLRRLNPECAITLADSACDVHADWLIAPMPEDPANQSPLPAGEARIEYLKTGFLRVVRRGLPAQPVPISVVNVPSALAVGTLAAALLLRELFAEPASAAT